MCFCHFLVLCMTFSTYGLAMFIPGSREQYPQVYPPVSTSVYRAISHRRTLMNSLSEQLKDVEAEIAQNAALMESLNQAAALRKSREVTAMPAPQYYPPIPDYNIAGFGGQTVMRDPSKFGMTRSHETGPVSLERGYKSMFLNSDRDIHLSSGHYRPGMGLATTLPGKEASYPYHTGKINSGNHSSITNSIYSQTANGVLNNTARNLYSWMSRYPSTSQRASPGIHTGVGGIKVSSEVHSADSLGQGNSVPTFGDASRYNPPRSSFSTSDISGDIRNSYSHSTQSLNGNVKMPQSLFTNSHGRSSSLSSTYSDTGRQDLQGTLNQQGQGHGSLGDFRTTDMMRPPPSHSGSSSYNHNAQEKVFSGAHGQQESFWKLYNMNPEEPVEEIPNESSEDENNSPEVTTSVKKTLENTNNPSVPLNTFQDFLNSYKNNKEYGFLAKSAENIETASRSTQHLGLTQTNKNHLGMAQTNMEHLGLAQTHKDHLGIAQKHKDHLGIAQTHKDDLGIAQTHKDDLGIAHTNKEHLGLTQTNKEHIGLSKTHKDHLGIAHTNNEHLGLTQTNKDHVGLAQTHKYHLGIAQTNKKNLGMARAHEDQPSMTKINKEHLDLAQANKENIRIPETSKENIKIMSNTTSKKTKVDSVSKSMSYQVSSNNSGKKEKETDFSSSYSENVSNHNELGDDKSNVKAGNSQFNDDMSHNSIDLSSTNINRQHTEENKAKKTKEKKFVEKPKNMTEDPKNSPSGISSIHQMPPTKPQVEEVEFPLPSDPHLPTSEPLRSINNPSHNSSTGGLSDPQQIKTESVNITSDSDMEDPILGPGMNKLEETVPTDEETNPETEMKLDAEDNGGLEHDLPGSVENTEKVENERFPDDIDGNQMGMNGDLMMGKFPSDEFDHNPPVPGYIVSKPDTIKSDDDKNAVLTTYVPKDEETPLIPTELSKEMSDEEIQEAPKKNKVANAQKKNQTRVTNKKYEHVKSRLFADGNSKSNMKKKTTETETQGMKNSKSHINLKTNEKRASTLNLANRKVNTGIKESGETASRSKETSTVAKASTKSAVMKNAQSLLNLRTKEKTPVSHGKPFTVTLEGHSTQPIEESRLYKPTLASKARAAHVSSQEINTIGVKLDPKSKETGLRKQDPKSISTLKLNGKTKEMGSKLNLSTKTKEMGSKLNLSTKSKGAEKTERWDFGKK